MKTNPYRDELESLVIREFVPAGYQITKGIELDPVPESSKYAALVFSLNEKSIVYRKGKVTADRPGAFLAIWQRPSPVNLNDNKPMPLTSRQLDYLIIQVESHAGVTAAEAGVQGTRHGLFIFPVALLVERGIVCSTKSKGKTGFRVFPPWSQDRGVVGTKLFSASGKKTQRWQLPYFLEIDQHGSIDAGELKKLIPQNNSPVVASKN